MFWGIWIVNPFWNVFTSADIYSKAAGFAPEWAWGTWSTICGLTMLGTLFRGAFKTLALALAFCTWHWFTIAGMFWWGDWQNTAGLTYTFVGIYALYSYLNVKINYVRPGFMTHF